MRTDITKKNLFILTSINKVEGNVSISSLGQEELDKYNEDNLTLYKLLPTDCYTLPNSISFDGEVSALLDIKFNKKTGDLSTSEEYMLPIIVSVDDRKAEIDLVGSEHIRSEYLKERETI